MSSYVAACAVLPAVSCTFVPLGTGGSAGAGPRPIGTTLHRSVALSASQSHGSPVVALRPLAASGALPVLALAIHRSMPSARVLRNDSFEPSREKRTFEMFAFGGTATFVSFPPSIDLRVMA